MASLSRRRFAKALRVRFGTWKPSPGKGGVVTVTGPGITVRGNVYRPISWGGNPGGGYVLGDDLQRVVKP